MSYTETDSKTEFYVTGDVAKYWDDLLDIWAEELVDNYYHIKENDPHNTEKTNSDEFQLVDEVGPNEDEILYYLQGVINVNQTIVHLHYNSEDHTWPEYLTYSIMQDILRKRMIHPVAVEYNASYDSKGGLDGGVMFMTKNKYYNTNEIMSMLVGLEGWK